MANEKTVNYTAEQETQLQQLYGEGRTIEELAQHFDKSERSIVAKLSRMGLYQSKTKKEPGQRVTKRMLVENLQTWLGLDNLETLEKADKEALVSLCREVERLKMGAIWP